MSYRLLVHFATARADAVPYYGQAGRDHVRAECRSILRGDLGSPATSVEIQRPIGNEWTTVETVS